jgi:hypothetical protein
VSGMTMTLPAGIPQELLQKAATANAWCVLSGNHILYTTQHYIRHGR